MSDRDRQRKEGRLTEIGDGEMCLTEIDKGRKDKFNEMGDGEICLTEIDKGRKDKFD